MTTVWVLLMILYGDAGVAIDTTLVFNTEFECQDVVRTLERETTASAHDVFICVEQGVSDY